MKQLDIDQNRLIELASGGDGYAFEELITPYEKMMYSLALRMSGNAEDAKDCLQDAMLRIYKALPNFKGESAFSTWAYRIVANTCLDKHRRKKVRKAESLDALSEAGWNAPDKKQGPVEESENEYLKKVLGNALTTLPEDIRVAVVMRDVEGFSYEEISDVLSINIGTVKSRISRGREKLRGILGSVREQFM